MSAPESRFAQALAERPAPRRLGDVALRYEPSMLIGETLKPLRSSWPTVAVGAGLSSLVVALGLFLLNTPTWSQALAVSVTGACFLLGRFLEARSKRRRAFVLNFVTYTLRLDFVTPVAGHARTLLVPFSAVRAVEEYGQADGRTCLTVDFELDGALYREVLIAHLLPPEAEALERTRRVLTGAFGLGVIERAPGEPPNPPESQPTDTFG